MTSLKMTMQNKFGPIACHAMI